jgi:hypothetical protein
LTACAVRNPLHSANSLNTHRTSTGTILGRGEATSMLSRLVVSRGLQPQLPRNSYRSKGMHAEQSGAQGTQVLGMFGDWFWEARSCGTAHREGWARSVKESGDVDGKVVLRGIREDLKDARFKERVVRLPIRADQPTHVTSDSAVGEVKSLRGTEQYRSQHSRWNHRHDFVRGRPSEIIGVAWGNSDRVRNITPVIQTIQCSHQKRLRASAFS